MDILVKDETFYFKDGNLIWLKDISENVNSQFIFYYINSAEGQKTIWVRTIGSAQPALTIDLVKHLQFPWPPLETQQKIAEILSDYDDLIEKGYQFRLEKVKGHSNCEGNIIADKLAVAEVTRIKDTDLKNN